MKRIVSVTAVLCLCSLAIGQGVAPTNPVEVSTEVGSAATASGKISVSVKAAITRKAISVSTVLASNGGVMDFVSIELDDDAVTAMIASLEAIIKAPDTNYKKELAGMTIEATDFNGERTIIIREKSSSLLRSSIYLKMDGGEALLPVLKKSLAVKAWLVDKIGSLQVK